MSNEKPLHAPTEGRLALFQEFLKHPLQIGSVISSSRFLESRVVETSGIDSAKTIVEAVLALEARPERYCKQWDSVPNS